MRERGGRMILLVAAAMSSVVLVAGVIGVTGQTQTNPTPRTKSKPDFSGIWQAMNTANWDLLAHEAKRGPVVALGAAFSIPGGTGVVEGNEIPYLPQAAAKKKENADNWLMRDPEIRCFLPGVPRMIYMPYPFQIVQGADTIMMASEFASATRTIRMNSKDKSPTDSWMGWNVGHWEGDTLVVDVTDQIDQTWLDRAGDFHSDALHVVERFSAIDRNTLNYEATIEDPKVFSRPWKIRMPLYRRVEKNRQLLEYKCVEFVEELMYGHLRKRPSTGQ
jgi:hypothetical protein